MGEHQLKKKEVNLTCKAPQTRPKPDGYKFGLCYNSWEY
jgi:hypothetical protein